MPLNAGDEWRYEAKVQWTVPNTNEVRSAKIVWKTRVVAAYATADSRAAVVLGSPLALAWYEPRQQPNFSVFVENRDGLFIASASSREEADALARKQTAGDQLLQFPMKVGTCVGGDDADRADNRYCWLVSRKIAKGWELTHRTAPDHQTVRIVPNVGITRYRFVHHGTVASADVRLVSFTKAK